MAAFKTQIKNGLDWLKSQFDVPGSLVKAFQNTRDSAAYQRVFDNPKPLISVCIPTYNRAELLTTRCLPSILNQTYSNLEIIVVGDCCTDDTEQRVQALGDNRIRFANLEQRGDYPSNPRLRWMVAGTKSVNHTLSMARGDFITHLDDDDEYLPNRIQDLLAFTQANCLDLVWHPFYFETAPDEWRVRECERFEKGSITTSSSFYHGWFKTIHWNIKAYRFYEPGDWNRYRRIRHLGVNAARYSGILLRHYREHSQQSDAASEIKQST